MAKAFTGVTDPTWYTNLLSLEESSSSAGLEEVNFWKPSALQGFHALRPGELFLFKLKYPLNFIVGGGLFAHFSKLPVSLAWEAFGAKNGAYTFTEMRSMIAPLLSSPPAPTDDFVIGCILIEKPFFLAREKWILPPSDMMKNIVTGKTYDISSPTFSHVIDALQSTTRPSSRLMEPVARYGQPTIVFPRLGQGSFRILVTDAYERRCAMTGERTLPVLDAAHIQPFEQKGPNTIANGVLLRKDLHALFDKGYITITPKLQIEVSRKIKEEFENGRDYYALQGQTIRTPYRIFDHPSPDLLSWHNQNIFKA